MMWQTRANPMVTFPTKKRINTQLFIDRTATLYIGDTQIRVITNEGAQPVALNDWRRKYTLHVKVILVLKGVGIFKTLKLDYFCFPCGKQWV